MTIDRWIRGLLAVNALAGAGVASAQTSTFDYSGAPVPYVVPAGVWSLDVDVYGAAGGGNGGLGGRVIATLAVTPGETLTVVVGGGGGSNSGQTRGLGGYNGGGNGGTGVPYWGTATGGDGGGGASDIRRGGAALTHRVVVAGGGGGSGSGNYGGGTGGGLTGGTSPAAASYPGGGGATQTAGGANAHPTCGYQTTVCVASGFGQGAEGYVDKDGGGGGGGGWYGGGAGAGAQDSFYPTGGGGGSGYADPAVTTNVTQTNGVRSGHGRVVITPIAGPPPAEPSSTLSHQGRLLDALGAPVHGTFPSVVTLYDDGGDDVFTTTPTVTVTDGYYAVSLVDVPQAAFSTPLEIGVQLGSMPELRQPLVAVPFAAVATSVAGGTVNAREILVNDVPLGNTGGQWVGPAAWASEGTTVATTAITTSWTETQAVTLPGPGTYLITSNFRVRHDGTTQGFVTAQLRWTDSSAHTSVNRMVTERIPSIGSTFNNYGGSVSWIITTDAATTVRAWYLASAASTFTWYNDSNGVPQILAIKL
jgi:hypothetical protein